MPQRLIRAITAGLILLIAHAATAQDRPQVIVVNKALHDMTTHLLGDSADVVYPVPEGVDPSFWRPSIADISMIQSADLIVLNGAGFATWIDRVSLPRSRLVNSSAGLEDQFIVTESITHSHGDGGEHSHEGLASYTWLDPDLAKAQAETIAAAVIARDLAPAEDVELRLDDLTSELATLDNMSEAALKNARNIAIIATHPRYQYVARRYAISITSLAFEAGAMPSEDDLNDLAQVARDEGARILIWEAEPPAAALDAATGLGLHNIVFEPGATHSGTGRSFIEAYKDAISDIGDAISHNSN